MALAVAENKTSYIRAFRGPLPLEGLTLSQALRYSSYKDCPLGETGMEHIQSLLPPETFAFQFLEVEDGLRGIFGRHKTVRHFQPEVYVIGEQDDAIDPLTEEPITNVTTQTGDRIRIDARTMILEPEFYQTLPSFALSGLVVRL